MRLFFICLDDYPRSGACSKLLSNLFFYGGMNNADYEINVLTRRNSPDELSCEDFHGIKIYRCFIWSFFAFKRKYRDKNAKGLSLIKVAYAKVLNKVSLKADKKFFYGFSDSIQLYINLKKLNIGKNDIVLPVAGYFSTVAAALKIKQKTNCKLITYLVDPCSTNAASEKNTTEARNKFEQTFFEKSDKIITTPLVFQEVLGMYEKSIIDKTISMEFPNVICTDRSSEREPNDRISCVYSGRLYAGRNIYYVLNLFSYLKDCGAVLQLVGISSAEVSDKNEYSNVEYYGYMSIDDTKCFLSGSDFLINIGNRMTNQVPSKLFEYISTGKPIINICQNKNCPTLLYLKKYPYVLNVFENEKSKEEQAEEIRLFITNNIGKRATNEEIVNIFEECTPQYCAKQMNEIFKSL